MTRRIRLSAIATAMLLAGCGSTVATKATVGAAAPGLSGDAQAETGVGRNGTPTTSDTSGVVGLAGPNRTTNGAASSSTNASGSGGSPNPGLPVSRGTGPSLQGVGWDAHTVNIGVPTEEDLQRYLGTVGISFNPGSIQGDVRAIAADLNAKGGLFGRKILPLFHDNSTTSLQSNPEAAAQANCSDFTQDHHVIAVLNGVTPIDTDAFRQCLKQHRVPLLSIGYATYDDEIYRQFGPYLWTTAMPDLSRFIPGYVSDLATATYFSGWDTKASRPAGTPAKVGLLEPDTRFGHVTATLLQAALRSHGILVEAPFFYTENGSSYGSDMSSAVLKFNTAGVTHILDITNVAAPVLVFAQTAQRQRYFPRYGMSSWLLPSQAATIFAQSGIQAQLNGSIGVGWTPGGDVNTAQDPGETPAQRECRNILARGGQTFAGDGQRYALFVGYVLCDAIRLLVTGALDSRDLTPDAIAAGIARAGSRVPVAATFKNGSSSTTRALPSAFRDLYYTNTCSCFEYRGPLHTF